MRIALLGAECTGKTQLATELLQALNTPPGSAVGVPEVLRAWCVANARTPQEHEQEAIARQQAASVERLSDPGYIIADTTPLMTAIYSELLFQDSTLYPLALEHQRQYGLTLVMGLDLPWVADGIQRDGSAVRAQVDVRLRQVLETHALPYCMVYGRGTARSGCALQAIAHQCNLASAKAVTRASNWQWNCEKCSDARCEHQMFSALLKADSMRSRSAR